MWWKSILILAALAIGVLATAYLSFFEYDRDVTFRKVVADRATLFDGIESYTGVDDYRRALDGKSVKYAVEYPEPSGKDDDRPPFDMTLVTIERYEHLDHPGRLVVSFFNNRLASTTFYPSDMNAYLESLRQTTGIDLIADTERPVGRYARTWRAVDYQNRAYVGWEDVRLASEIQLWIKRYAAGSSFDGLRMRFVG